MTTISLLTLPNVFVYSGVALFAATGAMAAAPRKHDAVTFVFFAAITGLGGGTLRDLLLGQPITWAANAGGDKKAFMAEIESRMRLLGEKHERPEYE